MLHSPEDGFYGLICLWGRGLLFKWNVFRRSAATAHSLELTRGGGSSLFVLRAEHPGP
jgi:hypothetical protein